MSDQSPPSSPFAVREPEPPRFEPLDRHWALEPQPVPPPPRIGLHALLLFLTFVTTTWMGLAHYYGFLVDFVPRPLLFTSRADLLAGALWYSVPVMTMLAAHEAGHYLACRHYGIDATLPYFLPLPAFIGLSGTLGAFIRIRGRILRKAVLFDVGVAGPLAGFAVLVPMLVAGVAMSRMVKLPADFVGFELGEPLLFQLVSRAIWGPVPDGYSLNLHPMAFAAWFGMLMTALNLFPIGQLDGGHISYAVLGDRSTHLTLGALAIVIGLAVFFPSWILWAVLLVVMLRVFGLRHPPTEDHEVALDSRRLVVAALALLVFAACFTPAPIQPYELIKPR